MTSPISLLNLAAQSVVFEVGKHVISRVSNEETSTLLFMDERDLMEAAIESLTIPATTKNLLREYIDSTTAPVTIWIQHHSEWGLLAEESHPIIENYLGKLIWNTDYTINYRETAKNVLQWGELKSDMKFRWACTYCLTDEIVRYGKAAVDCNTKMDDDPLISYWIKWLNHGHDSAENFVLEKLISTGKWAALEYFILKVSPEERIAGAVDIVMLYNHGLQRRMLSLLSQEERKVVVQQAAIPLIVNFVEIGDFDNARRIWLEVKGTLDASVVRGIAFHMLHLSDVVIGTATELYHDEVANFFTEIWSALDTDNKRNFILEDMYHSGFNAKYFISEITAEYNDKVIRVVLKDQEEHVSRGFFKDHWEWLLVGQKIATVYRLLEDFVTEEDVISCKVLLRNSPNAKKHCMKLLKCGYIGELENFVTFLLDDPNQLSDEIKSLIRSPKGDTACQYNLIPNRWRGFRFFLDHHFADEADDIKFQIINRSLDNTGFFYSLLTSGSTESKYIIACTNAYVTNLEFRSYIKRKVIGVVQEGLATGGRYKFERTSFDELVTWCLGAEETARFK